MSIMTMMATLLLTVVVVVDVVLESQILSLGMRWTNCYCQCKHKNRSARRARHNVLSCHLICIHPSTASRSPRSDCPPHPDVVLRSKSADLEDVNLRRMPGIPLAKRHEAGGRSVPPSPPHQRCQPPKRQKVTFPSRRRARNAKRLQNALGPS